MRVEKEKTVVKSIRISSSLDERLEAVSRRRNITESAYLSDALQRQILLEPITPALEGIFVERRMFRLIVSLANRESIEILGAEIARHDLPFALELLALPQRRESLLMFLSEITADSWHWFKIGLNPRGETRILLYHNFGINWSLFLKSYIVEAFALVSEPPPSMTVTERLVKVDWAESIQRFTVEPPARTQRDSLMIRRS
jgi:predicted transcriptional regulator